MADSNDVVNRNADVRQMADVGADQAELEGLMSGLMSMQSQVVSLLKNPDDPEALHKVQDALQNKDFRDMYGKLMKMQSKYMTPLMSSEERAALPGSDALAETKKMLKATMSKVKAMSDEMGLMRKRIELLERKSSA